MEKKAVFKPSVRQMALCGMLSAVSIVLGMTPLGFIPIPPVKATIMHVPVIIGAIVDGPITGVIVGLVFGLFSIFQAVTSPTPVSFVFLNPLISILPRILIGLATYYVFKKLPIKKMSVRAGIAAVCGTLVNTLGVLSMIYVIYLQSYAAALGISAEAAKAAIVTVGVTQGIPEAIISAAITIPVVTILNKVRK